MFHPVWIIAFVAATAVTGATSEALRSRERSRASEEAILQYGKAIDISRLDPVLPSEPLGNWFFSIVGPRVDYLVWSAIDCGQPKDPPPETPECLRAEAKWRQDRAAVVVTVDVEVTSRQDGPLSPKPKVFAVSVRTVASPGASEAESAAIFHVFDGQRLGELKALLEKAAVQSRAAPAARREP